MAPAVSQGSEINKIWFLLWETVTEVGKTGVCKQCCETTAMENGHSRAGVWGWVNKTKHWESSKSEELCASCSLKSTSVCRRKGSLLCDDLKMKTYSVGRRCLRAEAWCQQGHLYMMKNDSNGRTAARRSNIAWTWKHCPVQAAEMKGALYDGFAGKYSRQHWLLMTGDFGVGGQGVTDWEGS